MYASAIYLNLFLIVEIGKLFRTDSNDAEFSFHNQLVVTVNAVVVYNSSRTKNTTVFENCIENTEAIEV